jgi:hypothetical protein
MTITSPTNIKTAEGIALNDIKKNPSLGKELDGNFVRIWSNEHNSWWRPQASGYTDYFDAAGIYMFEEAWAKTFHCGPEKQIYYVAVKKDGEHINMFPSNKQHDPV